jgi:peptidoglycan/xylan/chitin deacetylase (PgdA/CDA1 family)
LQWLWVHMLLSSGTLWWVKRKLRHQGYIVVLTCHRVLEDAAFEKTNSQPEIILRRRTFEQLAAYLARHCEMVDLRHEPVHEPGPKLRVALTFDDGWRDNYTTALPIARGHQIPFTIFICTELLGANSPFWPERAMALCRARRPRWSDSEAGVLIEHLKTLPPHRREAAIDTLADEVAVNLDLPAEDETLKWGDVLKMSQECVNFGSHTQTHQILTLCETDAEISRELRGSRRAIEAALGKCCDVFAYPNGNWSPQTQRLLKEAGFRLAFTTRRGAWAASSDKLAIPRINVSESNVIGLAGRFSPAMFEYTTFWKTWRAMRYTTKPQSKRAEFPPLAASIACDRSEG